WCVCASPVCRLSVSGLPRPCRSSDSVCVALWICSPAVLMPSSDGLSLIPWPASVIEFFQVANASQTLLAQSSAAVAELSVPLAPEELLLPPPQPAARIAAERIRTARSERMAGMLATYRHVDADNVPVLERSHLHKIAELIRQTEPSPAWLVENRLAPAGK